jgi:hypothetical protein
MHRSHKAHPKRILTGASVLALTFFGVGTTLAIAPSAAGASSPTSFTCSGGDPNTPTVIPPGSYGSMTVAGVCALGGAVEVTGGLTVAPNAALLATDSSNCSQVVHLDVSGGIRVLNNAILFMGDSNNRPNAGTGCPTSNDVVNGGIVGQASNSVVIHGTRINGGFSLNGGGGGNSYIGPGGTIFCADITINGVDAGTPPFSDVEDSQINGGASIVGLHTCWMGFIANQVNGGTTVSNNTMGDPDAIEIGLNVIHGGLGCSGNLRDPNSHIFPDDGSGGVPTNSFDGSPPNPNTVSGQETGQCAGL